MKTSPENAPPAPRAADAEIYPLDEFYAARAEELPEIATVRAEAMPEPFHSLLVHNTDMTSTLERFYGEGLHVEVLARRRNGDDYYREVVLVLNHSKKRVEFGAIKINLNLFPAGAREIILREREPLGRILNRFKVAFSSRPSVYLRVAADTFISTALQTRHPAHLFGRRNSLFDAWEQPLAEIVEILPPLSP